jgi:hypothetical protein
MECTEERVRDLMLAYDAYKATHKQIDVHALYADLVVQPAPRFYVSETRARVVVSRMMKGDKLQGMRPLKRAMFEEIHRRVKVLAKEHPKADLSLLCAEVVTQPAPQFYLSPASAKILICQARKKWYQEKMKRLRLYACL